MARAAFSLPVTECVFLPIGLVIAPGVRYDFVHQRENTLDAWNARVRLKQKLLLHLI